jgi:hypothetical protein
MNRVIVAALALALAACGKSNSKPDCKHQVDELDRLTRGDRANAATQMARLMKEQFRSCPALAKVFDSIARDEGGDKAGEMIEGTGPALLDCNCSVDVPNVRSLLYRSLANTHPTTELVVRVMHDAPPLALPAATPWRDAAAKLVARAWLVAT